MFVCNHIPNFRLLAIFFWKFGSGRRGEGGGRVPAFEVKELGFYIHYDLRGIHVFFTLNFRLLIKLLKVLNIGGRRQMVGGIEGRGVVFGINFGLKIAHLSLTPNFRYLTRL